MYAIDFEYDGRYLSDYGFIVCNFDYSDGADMVSAGSTISFNKVKRKNGKQFSLVSANYEDCIQTTFDICKNPDIYSFNEREISETEYRDLMRWLNRKEFLKFRPIETDKDTCFYNASFNIEKIKIMETLYGLRLSMETDKPFGFGEKVVKEIDITPSDIEAQKKFEIEDCSDEIGYTYPDLEITCMSDGDFWLKNETLGLTTYIANVSRGEIIKMWGNSQIISSSLESHKLFDDFNFVFFKIENTFENRKNIISTSSPCKIVLSYLPSIKDTP